MPSTWIVNFLRSDNKCTQVLGCMDENKRDWEKITDVANCIIKNKERKMKWKWSDRKSKYMFSFFSPICLRHFDSSLNINVVVVLDRIDWEIPKIYFSFTKHFCC